MSPRPDFYGKYSLGSGAVLSDKDKVWSDLADPDVIVAYEASIRRDLAKSGITPDSLARWNVMDVGTGRQALALLNIGAKHVSHFDISQENVERVKSHILATSLGSRLDTICCDLVEFDLGRDRFDLVYLNGIVQHFSDVGRGVGNCMRALKLNGLLWLYFYRSGTFDNFVLYMLRKLASGSNVITNNALMRDYFVAARLFFAADADNSYLTSIFMDGVFTRYARLYSARTYLDAVRACGFEVVSSSGLDPVGRDVDHYFARAAAVVTFKKTKVVSDREIEDALQSLAPAEELDQLDRRLYHEPEILRSIDLYSRLSRAFGRATLPNDVKMLVVMRLFAFLAEKTRSTGYEPLRRHQDFHELLERMIDLINTEYGLEI